MKKQDCSPLRKTGYELLQNAFYHQELAYREARFSHNPYNHELREVAAIERGDVETLGIIFGEDFSSNHGMLSDDPLRQEIDIGIVVVTLASRAAMRAGLHYEKAFTLSDAAIQLMEKATDPAAVKEIYAAAQLMYTELVRDLKSSPAETGEFKEINPHIEHCKDYIFSHLHGKLTVAEIADFCGLNPNYLPSLFVKYEHVTLKQYIMNEKITLVRRMLTYSPYSYVEIAAYLGFSSQSHMGTEFKKATGMTPHAYRNKFQKDDFLPE